MFPVNGSLRMAPLFPRSGPGESGSPMSQVLLRCYDFPPRLSGHLFASLPGSTRSSSVRVSQLALPQGRRCLPGQGRCLTGDPICRFACTWTCAGPPRFPGDPSCAFASFQDPGRIDDPSPICRSRRCCPRFADSEGFSVSVISGLSRGFSTCCLRFKNGVATTHAKLASGWLARLYREGVEPSGSQQKVSDHSSSFSGFILALPR